MFCFVKFFVILFFLKKNYFILDVGKQSSDRLPTRTDKY